MKKKDAGGRGSKQNVVLGMIHTAVQAKRYLRRRGGRLLLVVEGRIVSLRVLVSLPPYALSDLPRLLLLPFQGLLLLGVQFLFANNGAVLAVLLPQRELSCFQLFRSVFTHKRHGDVGWGSVRKKRAK